MKALYMVMCCSHPKVEGFGLSQKPTLPKSVVGYAPIYSSASQARKDYPNHTIVAVEIPAIELAKK